MLSNYDYTVIAFYFLFMFSIGFVFKAFSKDSSDYFRGGGSMLWWMVGASAFMTQFSAWTFTGAASEAYANGFLVAMIFFANAFGYFMNYLWTSYRFRRMRVITPVEAIRDRFGRFNEQVFTWLSVPVSIVYAGIWLNGLAVITAAVFGIDFKLTILLVGCVVVVMSVTGGSWAVVASDFIQMLIIMVISLVVAFRTLLLPQIGGFSGFLEKIPYHHIHWTEMIRPEIVYLWIFAMFIKQFIGINSIQDSYRYLSVKNGEQARKAALLACFLMLVGPLVWFIPPMAARILQPDIGASFPGLVEAGRNPAEAAYIYLGFLTLPKGMLGLLVCGLFAATMSSMDTGLNRTAGIFIKNFYQPYLAPSASELKLLVIGKITSAVLGGFIILTGLFIGGLRSLDLFNIMLQFSSLVVLPMAIPMIWGIVIRRSPAWSGWSTIIVGLMTSFFVRRHLNPEWFRRLLGYNEVMTTDEKEYFIVFAGILTIVVLCSAWFLCTVFFDRFSSREFQDRVDRFFKRMATPIDFKKEIGEEKDDLQSRTLGILCSIYGGFIFLLALIPNELGGRLSFLFCGGAIIGIGALLIREARATKGRDGHPSARSSNL